MNNEDLNEIIVLDILLSDQFITSRLKHEKPDTLTKIVNRYTVLIDEIINHYELPNPLTTNPLK